MTNVKIESTSNTDGCQIFRATVDEGRNKVAFSYEEISIRSEQRGKQTLILQFKIQSKIIMDDNTAVMWLCCSLNLTSILYASVPQGK